MRWPAVLVFVAACGAKAKAGGGAIENRSALAQGSDATGPYWCTIDDGGYKYPKFACTISRVNDKLVIAKLGGSVRFRGEISPQQRGYAFSGQLFCPWGDCDQQLHGTFAPAPGGALRGTFRDNDMIVELVRAPQGAFGGASYGGAAYGGATYGE